MPVVINPLMACALLLAALLGGCGDKAEKKASTQVAARVNDSEITIHQVNNQLARSGITAEAQAKEASKKILDTLIDQELLEQQAKRKKLDRDPAVMQAIEDAKRQILSQAYLERMVYNANPPSPAETKDFYDKHPELFAKRKVYKVRTYALLKAKFDDGLKAALDTVKNPADAAAALRGRGIEYKESEAQWVAEQVPMELLPSFAKMKPGDILSLDQGGQPVLMLLESTADAPVNETQAKPLIEKYIVNSRNKELLDNKLKQLRAVEEITYLGQFAPAQEAQAKPEPADPAKPAPNPAQPQPDNFIQKGLQGL